MIENPFLSPPQVESPASRSWGLGFAFGFQGPEHSTMPPADIQPEDANAFDKGVLAGQDAAINGLAIGQPCVDLNVEGPSVPHLAVDGAEAASALVSLVAHGIAAGLSEGVFMLVTLSFALQTTFDDPDTALADRAAKLSEALTRMGITDSMQLFVGGAVDISQPGCGLLMTPIFRSLKAATDVARAIGRAQWLVVSWRTDESASLKLEDFISQ